MKTILKLSMIILFLKAGMNFSIAQQAFTPGNLVVERLGDSVIGGGSSFATPIYLDEYTTAGSYVQSVLMDTVVVGLNRKITESGSSGSDALMTRSNDGRYLCVSGFDAAVLTASIAATSSTSHPRLVGRVDANGTKNVTTTLGSVYSATKLRAAITDTGGVFYTSGNGGGIYKVNLGNTGAPTLICSSPATTKALTIYNGQLYVGSSTSPKIGINKVGTGLPTSSTSLSTLPGTSYSNSLNPYEFVFLVLPSGDTVLYVADQTNGLMKFSDSSGTWLYNGAISGGYTGLIGAVNCSGKVVLYFTTSASTSNPMNTMTDTNGYKQTIAGTVSTIVSGNAYYFRKGVTFTPYNNVTVSSTQNISAGSYQNITINSGGVATLIGNITIVGMLTINSGGTLICNGYNVLGNSDFQNSFVLQSGGTLEIGSANGITANAASGNIQTCTRYYSTGANYVYNGTTNQVTGDGLPSTNNSLTIANTGSTNNNIVTLNSNLTIASDVTINTGVLDVSTNNYSINVAGNFYNNSSFTCRAATVTFNGSTAETFLSGNSTFNNVVINNSTTNSITLSSNLSLNNDLTITHGTLNVSSSNYGITLGGNFINNASFSCHSGTVTFNGSGSQSLNSGSSYLYNVIVNNSGTGSITLSHALNLLHDLTITTGTLDVSNNNYAINLFGSFYNYGTFSSHNGTVTFNGNSNTEYFRAGASTFYNVVIDNSTNDSIILASNAIVGGALTINNGVLDVSGNNYSLTVAGDFTNYSFFSAEAGTLTVAGNFYDEYYFNAQSGTVILNGSGLQYVDNINGDYYNNITINNMGSGVYLTTYLLINGVLNCLNGAVYLNGAGIYITNNSSSAITRTNGYIVSETYSTQGSNPDIQVDNYTISYMQWNIGMGTGIFTFPFGTNAGQYIPYAIQNTSGHDLGVVSVATWNAPYNTLNIGTLGPLPQSVTHLNNISGDNSNNTVKRFWQLDKSGTDAVSAMTFSCASTEAMNNNNSTSIASLFPQRWNGTAWERPLTAGSPLISIPSGAASATVINIPNFSPWALVGNSSPLPIELLSFDATYITDKNLVQVNWETVSEINNDHFTIEKSNDGENFQDIGTVQGAGNSNTKLSYSFDDKSPLSGTSYYRLKQTDFDGKYTFSKEVVVTININNNSDNFSINIYPNPASGNAFINFYSNADNEPTNLKLTDLQGRVIIQDYFTAINGFNAHLLNLESIPEGVYFIILHSTSFTQTQKMFVHR